MRYQYVPYIWPLLASSAVSFGLGLYALLKQRHAKYAVSFIVSMMIVTIWSAGNALEMSAADFETKLFFANIQYFAFCYSPVALLALCMQFTGYDKLIRAGKFWVLLLLPTVIIILVWTDGYHGLMRYDMHLDTSGAFPVIAKQYGPAFYVHSAYAYALNFTAWVMLIRAVFSRKTVYRKQAVTLFIGVCMIIIPNLLYIFGLSPVKRFDTTPVFFGPAGVLITWAIFRYKFINVVPLARATVMETMSAGVMVLDLQGRVLDFNLAFEDITGLSAPQIAARNVEKVCAEIPELAGACMNRSVTHAEFSIDRDETSRVYEALLSPIKGNKGALIGRLCVVYEITKKKLAQQMFMKQQQKLAAVEERERMARDMHDNLGQVLGFINLQAQGIRKELVDAGVETGRKRIDRLVDAAQSAQNEIRKYLSDTRSSVYSEKDFMTALKNDVTRFQEQSGAKVLLDIPDTDAMERIEPYTRFNVQYIIKEALNNIQKHAQAKNARISICLSQSTLSVAVEDDGKGFETERSSGERTKTFGLNIMRERASEIGAEIDIRSEQGKGSRIMLRVPIKQAEVHTHEADAG